jgi:hypothetical protein
VRWVGEVGLLVSGGEDGVVCLVDVRVRGVVRVFRGHSWVVGVEVKRGERVDEYGREVVGEGVGVRVGYGAATHSITATGTATGTVHGTTTTGNTKPTLTHPHTHTKPGRKTTNPTNPTTQLIIPTERDSRTGPARPVGVVAFDYSPQGRYIASGGMKELLVWEPFTLEVLARLGGVKTPLVGVTVSDSLQRIFACTVGKVVHVYHSSSYQSLQVVVDGTVFRPRDELSQLMVISEPTLNPPLHRMYTAGNKLSLVSGYWNDGVL